MTGVVEARYQELGATRTSEAGRPWRSDSAADRGVHSQRFRKDALQSYRSNGGGLLPDAPRRRRRCGRHGKRARDTNGDKPVLPQAGAILQFENKRIGPRGLDELQRVRIKMVERLVAAFDHQHRLDEIAPASVVVEINIAAVARRAECFIEELRCVNAIPGVTASG